MLNRNQQLAYDAILKLADEPEGRLVIKGFGGVGKTYTVSKAVAKLVDDGYAVLVAAPTHEAKNVLKSAIGERNGVGYTTVASICGHFGIETELGDIRFVGRGLRDLSGFDLLVIDEASQISKWDCQLLLTAPLPILFIGDDGQLPPVKERVSSVFQAGLPTIELTEQMRNPGPIELVAAQARKGLFVPAEENDQVKLTDDILESFITALKAAKDRGERTDSYVFLAFTNSRVRQAAAAARCALNGRDEYAVGDWVRINNCNYQIESITHVTKHGFSGVTITAGRETFDLLNPQEEQRFANQLELLAKEGLRCKESNNPNGAAAYFNARKTLLNSWADAGSANSMTIHKAQGKTFDHVWVDTLDVSKGQGLPLATKVRMLYTGYSRAKTCLTIGANLVRSYKLGAKKESVEAVPQALYETLLMEAIAHYPVKPLKPQSIKAFMKGGWAKYADTWQEAWINRLEEHKSHNERRLVD